MKARMLFIVVALIIGNTHARAAGQVDLGSEIEVTLKKSESQQQEVLKTTPANETMVSYNEAWERLKRKKRVAYAKNDEIEIVLKPLPHGKHVLKKSVVVR